MVDRVRGDDSLTEEREKALAEAERLRWINARIREASEADLIEDAQDVDDEDDPPESGER
jgi:hypothetical protein